jgi:hypothetical protein
MKITQEHFNYLKSEIDQVLEKYNQDGNLVMQYEQGDFARSGKVKDLQKRFCFDVLFGAGVEKFVYDELYSYLNDDHIYTALKAICPEVTKRY